MNQSGHIKEATEDENGYRKFIVNCLGNNDQKKYFSITPFGIDYNAPVDTRSLTIDSRNKDASYNIGILNKVKIDDLLPGESALFSTDEPGETIVSQIVLRNTGDIEINKDLTNGNILIKADGTIEFNGNVDNIVGFTELKTGFDQLVTNHNDLVAVVNTIRGDQNTFASAYVAGGPAVQGLPPAYVITSSDASDSAATIDASKKDNLKCE